MADADYDVGASFLKLPARASRDGARDNEVVGTAIHIELFGSRQSTACVVVGIEHGTGQVVCSQRLEDTATAFAAFEEALWAVIRAYMKRLDAQEMPAGDRFRPATFTSTDAALADFIHGLMHGCGTDIVCVNADESSVQWPSDELKARFGSSNSDGSPRAPPDAAAPSLRVVVDAAITPLADAAVDGPFALLREREMMGACHHADCGKLALRRSLKRCSACKRAMYCSVACQTSHWKAGHKGECKKIQQLNSKLDVDGSVVEWA